MELDLFWNTEKIRKLIERDNSIKRSFIELLKGTAISIVSLAVSAAFLLNERTEINNSGLTISLFFVYANVFAWVYSLSLSVYLIKIWNRTKIPSQKDATADFLTVVNALQSNTLAINSIMYTMVLAGAFLIPAGATLITLGILIVFQPITLVLYVLSMLMQAYALGCLFQIEKIKAILMVIGSNIFINMLLLPLSIILQVFIVILLNVN
jgi:hypothetical protein